MVRLVDYVVVAGYAPHVKGGGTIVQRFPEQDWPDMGLPDGFEHFCMPHGWHTVRTPKPPFLHYGVLTDMSAERRYYACLVLFEPWRRRSAHHNRMHNSSQELNETDADLMPSDERSRLNSHSARQQQQQFQQHVPTCIAVISRFRQFDLFRRCLLIMHACAKNNNNVGRRDITKLSGVDSVERIVAVLSSGVSVPFNDVRIFSTACLVKIFITQQRTLSMIQRAESALPSTVSDCYLLLRLLGVDNVIYLVCAALTDHKLLLLSSSYARLNACAHAIESLMYPLQYSHTFVPVLPLSMVDYLGAPTPFIMGVRCGSNNVELPELLDVIHVDLDACRVDVPESVKVPFLPEPVRSHLRNSLMLSGDPALFTDDLAFPDSAGSLGAQNKSPSRRVQRTASSAGRLAARVGMNAGGRHSNFAEEYARDKEIRAVFLRAMAELLSGYRSFLSVVRIYHPDQLLPSLPPSSFNNSISEAPGLHNESYRAAINGGENFVAQNVAGKKARANDAVAVVVDEFAANESGLDVLAHQQRFQARFPVITFRRYAFLGLRQLTDNDFMRGLVQSEAFEQFISRFACPYRQLSLFDRVYATIVEDICYEDRLLVEAGHDGVGIDEAHGQRLHNIRDAVDGLVANETVSDVNTERQDLNSKRCDSTGDVTFSANVENNPSAKSNDHKRVDAVDQNMPLTSFCLDADLIVQLMDHYAHAGASKLDQCFSVQLPPFAQCREIPHGALADAVSRVPEMFNKARRLEVLQKCVDSIFAGRLVESRKVLPAIQRMLTAPEARIALTQQLARVPPELRCVDNDQFDLLVKLINTALQEESDTDDYGVAAAIVPLACEFYRKLNAGASQCLYTSLQLHSVWSSLTFWEHAFYADVQRQIRNLYTTLRSGSRRSGGGVVDNNTNDHQYLPTPNDNRRQQAQRVAAASAQNNNTNYSNTRRFEQQRNDSSESSSSYSADGNSKAERIIENNYENKTPTEEANKTAFAADDVTIHSLATLIENDCILPLTANEMQKLGIFGGGANNVYRHPDIISLKNDQIQQHASKEHDLVYSLAMLYGSRIMCMRIPLDIHSSTRKERAAAALRRHNSIKTDTTSSKRSFPHRFGFAVSSQRRPHPHHRGSNRQRRPYAASSSSAGGNHLTINAGGDNNNNNNNNSDSDNDDGDADDGSSVGSGESGCYADDSETQRDIETAVIRFIGRFLEEICRTCRVGDDTVQKLNLYVAGMVRMHVESVDVVYQEVKSLKISRKAHVAEPLLLPGERMLNSRLAQIAVAAAGVNEDASGFGASAMSFESLYQKYRELDRTGIHSYMLPDGRDEFTRNAFDTGHSYVRNTLCLLYPAEGALFITTHRIIWTGMSCVAAASGAPDGETFVITKSFPISALFKDKKIDSTYVKEADLFLSECLQLRSNAYEMLRLGFDAGSKVSTIANILPLDVLRKALAKLRYPATINDLPLFIELRARGVQFAGFGGGAAGGYSSTSSGGGSLLSGGKKKNQTLSAFKHTLRRTAVAAGLRSGNSNISSLSKQRAGSTISNTSATMRPRLPSNDKNLLRGGAGMHSNRPQSVVNIYDDRVNEDVKFHIASDAADVLVADDNDFLLPESPLRLLMTEYARLGMFAVAAGNDQPLAAQLHSWFRLSEVNSHYKMCNTYPALLTLPVTVSDAALETLSKLFRKQRFPIISWKHPTNDALLLRSAHYHGVKSVVQKFNNFKNTTSTLGTTNYVTTQQQNSASSAAISYTSPLQAATMMPPITTPIGGSSPLYAGSGSGQQQHRHQHADFEDLLLAVSTCVDDCRQARFQQRQQLNAYNAAMVAQQQKQQQQQQQQQAKNLELGDITPMSELSLMSDICREMRFDYESSAVSPVRGNNPSNNLTFVLPSSSNDDESTIASTSSTLTTTTRNVPAGVYQQQLAPQQQQQSDTVSINSSLYAASAPIPPQRLLRSRNPNYNTNRSELKLSTDSTSTIFQPQTAVHQQFSNKSLVHVFTDKSVARSMRALNSNCTFHAVEFLDLAALKATYKKMMQKVVPSAVVQEVDDVKITSSAAGGGGGEPNSSTGGARSGATITPATAAAAVAAATSNNAGSIVTKPSGKGGEQTVPLPFARLLAELDGLNWLPTLSNMLNTTALIVNILDDPPMRNAAGGGRSVLLALEDGADFTSQLSALVQLCIDPYYRTLHGFRVLIEKEWLAAGHRFAHHNRLIGVAAEKYTFAPYFLQFLDAVHQLLRLYPAAFQFNQYYVKFLAYHHTSNRFNTFLCDCEAQRASFGLLDFDGKILVNGSADNNDPVMFMSIWEYIAQVHSRSTLFYNFDYDEELIDEVSEHRASSRRVLRPIVLTSQLVLWDYYYTTTAGLGSLYEIELLQYPMHDLMSSDVDRIRKHGKGDAGNNKSTKPRSQLINGYNYADSRMPMAVVELMDEVVALRATLQSPSPSLDASDKTWHSVYRESFAAVRRRRNSGEAASHDEHILTERFANKKSRQPLSARQQSIAGALASAVAPRMPPLLFSQHRGSALLDAQFREGKLRDRVALHCAVTADAASNFHKVPSSSNNSAMVQSAAAAVGYTDSQHEISLPRSRMNSTISKSFVKNDGSMLGLSSASKTLMMTPSSTRHQQQQQHTTVSPASTTVSVNSNAKSAFVSHRFEKRMIVRPSGRVQCDVCHNTVAAAAQTTASLPTSQRIVCEAHECRDCGLVSHEHCVVNVLTGCFKQPVQPPLSSQPSTGHSTTLLYDPKTNTLSTRKEMSPMNGGSDQQRGGVSYEGVLSKRTGVLKGWKERYFVLDVLKHELRYYDDMRSAKTEPTPRGAISLQNITSVVPLAGGSDTDYQSGSSLPYQSNSHTNQQSRSNASASTNATTTLSSMMKQQQWPKGSNEFCVFEIRMPKKSVVLCAPDARAAKLWVEQIQAAINST